MSTALSRQAGLDYRTVQLKTQGTVARYRDKRMYARNGLVVVQDEKTGEEDVMSVRSFLHRVQAINDSLRISPRHERNHTYINYRAELETAVQTCLTVVQEAKDQGDVLYDPRATAAAMDRFPRTFAASL